jgi:hypothetical protein
MLGGQHEFVTLSKRLWRRRREGPWNQNGDARIRPAFRHRGRCAVSDELGKEVVERPSINAALKPGETEQEGISRIMSGPFVVNASLVASFGQGILGAGLTAEQAAAAVASSALDVNAGDLSGVEATLVSQAMSLNMIFAEMMRRGGHMLGKDGDAAERYFRIGLRAQNQSRMALETLANVKAGPAVFARQANISHGHQQVNNGAPSARAGKFNTGQTEVIDGQGS